MGSVTDIGSAALPESTVLRIGPAGWSYRDWNAVVYPRSRSRDFDALRWIAGFFDLVEVNVSFYRVPTPRVSSSWAERVAGSDLHFAVKVPSERTHGWPGPGRGDLGGFRDFLRPLEESGRLDVLLAQYPWSHRPSEVAVSAMASLRDALAPLAVVFEVRHAEWARPPWPERTIAEGLDRVHIDQPALAGNLGPDHGGGSRLYVRLHGRNSQNWFAREAGRDERYDWLYSPEDLRAWAQRIRALARRGGPVHVVTNNHFRGQAVVNALELTALLGRPAPRAPRQLLDHFPGLESRWASIGFEPELVAGEATRPDPDASAPGPPVQRDLFDPR